MLTWQVGSARLLVKGDRRSSVERKMKTGKTLSCVQVYVRYRMHVGHRAVVTQQQTFRGRENLDKGISSLSPENVPFD